MGKAIIYRKWGVGSASLIISIFSIMFSFTFINGKYIGDHILNGLGISFPKVVFLWFYFVSQYLLDINTRMIT